MQRYFIIAAIVIVLLGAGAWVYFAYFYNQASVAITPTPNPSLPSAGNVPAQSGGVKPGTVSETPAPNKVSKRLVQIDKNLVASGEVAYTASTTAGADIAVGYIERQSGNVFQYLVHAGTLARTSNKTIPGIEEAKWLPNGSLAYVRYLSGTDHGTINTYALPGDGSNGFFLSQNIVDLAVSATGLFSLASSGNGSTGTTLKTDGSQSKHVFTAPLTSLRVAFAGKTQYLAFTKPSALIAGFVYLINSTGNFTRIAGPLNGLVALPSPSGAWVLLSYTSVGDLKMSLLEVATNKVLPLPVATIADKCAWTTSEDAVYCGVPVSPSTSYAYPDDWYQGATSFADRIWKISVAGRYSELTLDFTKETKESLDATNLTLDPASQVLVFKNKNDGSLWSYEL